MTNSFLHRLQKWLDGSYKLSDEQAMQQMMREDDFAKDSFEGYMSMPEEAHGERLRRLHAKINAPSEPLSVTVGRGNSNRRLWLAAASLALLMGALWFFVGKDAEQEKMAVVADKTSEVLLPPAGTQAPESTSTSDIAASSEAKNAKTTLGSSKKMEGMSQEDDHLMANNSQPIPKIEALKESPRVFSDEVAVRDTKFEEKDLSPSKVAMEGADVVAAAPSPSTTITDQAKTAPANAEREAIFNTEALAKESKKKKGKTSAKPSNPPSGDGVVYHQTDRATKEKAKEADKLPNRPEPMAGMDAYRDYLRTALRKPDAAQQANVRGRVGLRFAINKDGRPFQIITTKSLGYGCNEEAIRLVLEGDFWTQGQENIVDLEIEF